MASEPNHFTESPDQQRNVVPPDVAHEPWPFRYQFFIREHNQVAVAILCLLSLAGCIFYFSVRAYVLDGFIDIDRANHVEVSFLVDINSADWPELANLPGIGPKLANAIIEFRETNGHYKNHDALTDVIGIGPAKLENLRPHLAPINNFTAAD